MGTLEGSSDYVGGPLMIYKAQKLINMCPDFSCCGRAGRLVVVSDLEIENRWWWCKFLGEFV